MSITDEFACLAQPTKLPGMDADEWDEIGTADRGRALMIAGVPYREGEELNMYEPMDFDSLPVDVQDKLMLLPTDWRKLEPYED
jgi:hypothetical protein